MGAIGHAVLPVTVSIKGITSQLNKELAQPAQAAAKRASDGINKQLKSGVESAAKAVEDARQREEKATRALVGAEKELESERGKAERKAKAVESAELKLQSARSNAQVKVAEQEAKLTKLRENGEATVEQLRVEEEKLNKVRAEQEANVIDAENKLSQARANSAAAADKLAGAEEKVVSKKKQAADTSEEVITATRRLDEAQDASAGSTGRFSGALDRVKESASKTGDAVVKAAEKYKVHAGLVVGAVGLLARNAVEYASEAEQSYGAAESVFGEHAEAIIAASKSAADAVGVSGREYRELASYMGAMLGNLGLPMEEVTSKTQDLVKIGADLAATFGGSTKDAVEAIGAVMRGETDPIERYGVSIKEADIKAKMAAMGLEELEGAAGKQAKAQAILALLTEQTASAQGQFARETDTAAHKQQVATAKMNDAKETIGTALLPVYAELMEKLAGVAKLAGEHPKLFTVLAGAMAGLAGAVLALGTVAPIFTAISTAAAAAGMSMWGYAAAQAAAVAPIAGIVAAVAAIGAALWAFFTKTEVGKRMWDALVDAFKSGVAWIKDVAVDGWNRLVEAMRPVIEFADRVKIAFEELFISFQGGDWGYGALESFIGADSAKWAVNAIAEVGEALRDLWSKVSDAPANVWGWLVDAWDAVSPVVDKVSSIVSEALINTFLALWDALKSVASIAMDLGKALGGMLLEILKALWDVVKGLWDALKSLWEVLSLLLLPVLKVVGGLVGGVLVGAFLGLVKGLELGAKLVAVLAKAFAWLVNNAIVPLIGWIGNLIGWLGEKLGGVFTWLGDAAKWLADALVWAWDRIKEGWDWLSNAIQVAWDSVIRPVFNFIAESAKLLFAVVATVLITPFILAWNTLSAAIKWAWENVVKPAWDALSTAAQWMWDNVLSPVFGWIGQQWNDVLTGMKVVWETILKPAWEAVQNAALWLWNNVLMPVFGWIKGGWDALVNGIKWVWENVLKPTWDAVGQALQWLNDTIIQPILKWVQDRWAEMAEGIRWVRENVIQPVFDAIGDGLNTLKGWFETAVDAIGRTWDRVKELTARPIKFVVDTVFNNGILKAWNAVVGFIGMDDKKMKPVELGDLGKYAHGGVLPGYTPGRDPYTFVEPRTGMSIGLSGGEAIMRPEWTRAVGGPAAVEQMNREARSGKLSKKPHDHGSAAYSMGGVIPSQAFANGGIVESMTRVMAAKFPMLQMTSGLRYTDNGYHSKGMAADFSNGYDSTPAMRAATQWIAQNYRRQTLQLIHSPSPYNIGGGAPVGDGFGFYGAGTMNQHRNHVHWAVNSPVSLDGAGPVPDGFVAEGGGGGGFFDMVASLIKPVWDKIIDAIPKYKASKGWVAETPANFLKTGANLVWEFVKSKASAFGGGGGNVDTSGVAGSNIQIGQELAKRAGWVGSEWEALKQLWQNESGWNHLAQNPTSTAYGIPQFLDSTWATVGYSKTSDPATQIAAGIKYIKQRPDYRVPSRALSLWQSRSPHWYDNGGYLKPGTTITQNDTGKPEPVFTAEQWAILRGNIITNAQARNWDGVAEDLRTVASGLQRALAYVGDKFGTSFVEGQKKDALGVFGLPDFESIPLVKAQKEWNEAVQKDADDAAKTAESTTRTADATERIAGSANSSMTEATSVPDPARAAPSPVTVDRNAAGGIGAAIGGAIGTAAQMAGIPGGAAIGSSVGQGVTIVTADMANAMQTFRTLQAQASAGKIGV